MSGDITSANAVLTLSVSALFPTPIQIQGFSTDDIYGIAAIKSVETAMGVDGLLSGGFVFVAIVQTLMLQADSASNDFFDTWWTNQQSGKGVFVASGLIKLPAITTKFNQTRGFLTSYTPAPAGKKTLQARSYEITWQNISPSPDR